MWEVDNTECVVICSRKYNCGQNCKRWHGKGSTTNNLLWNGIWQGNPSFSHLCIVGTPKRCQNDHIRQLRMKMTLENYWLNLCSSCAPSNLPVSQVDQANEVVWRITQLWNLGLLGQMSQAASQVEVLVQLCRDLVLTKLEQHHETGVEMKIMSLASSTY